MARQVTCGRLVRGKPSPRTKRHVPVRAVGAEAGPLVVARLEEPRKELAREPAQREAAPSEALDIAGKRAVPAEARGSSKRSPTT
ncbi:MAG: hypothetical protein ACXVEF_42075 [Polyangiales bacterium]